MADTTRSCFEETRQQLVEVGLSSPVTDLVAARLVVERVGEDTNLGWWDSLVLDETGYDRLDGVAPKTRLRTQIDLAQRVGRSFERARLPEDAVSLFSLGPRYEANVETALDGIESSDSETVSLSALEALNVSESTLEPDWTDGIVAALGSDTVDHPEPDRNGVVRFDEGLRESAVDDKVGELVAKFLCVYGSDTEPTVGHHPLNADLVSEPE